MYTLTTKENKSVSLDVAEIRISKNELLESGYFVELRLEGKLPQCRKSVTLSHSVGFGAIHLMPLFGNGKWHSVNPEEIRKLVKSVKIVPYKYDYITITPELETYARNHIESMCDCPAVKYKG